MAVCCPITSRRKRNNFEIVLPQGLKVKGVVLTHQVRSINWSERGAEFMTRLPDHVVDDVIDMIASILDLP